MKTIMMAGGRGTRISSIASDIPKPMIKIEGIPVLEREIISLREQGLTDIILTVSHMADQIIDYFGNGNNFGVNIEYFVEKKPIGNAGALFKLKDRLIEPFLLLNSDSVFDIDFKRFIEFHYSHKGLVTLFTHPNNHPYDSGVIITKPDGSVDKWFTKEEKRPIWYKNRVNAGIHIIDPKALDICGIDENNVGEEINGNIIKVDLDRHVLKPLCGTGKMFCYDSPEYVKDMGTPDRYKAVCRDYNKGIIQAKNLRNKQKAIFLDRDGTINKYVGFLKKIDQFELLPNVAEAIKQINISGCLAIVVTNQPVIARGEMTFQELEETHNKMETLLGEQGAYLDDIFYCPHHPDIGYVGEIPELKIQCRCRKPSPGLLIQATEKYNISLPDSWMIGDGKIDVEAGKAAGCKTALIGAESYGQDISACSLLDAVNKILNQ